MSKLFSRTLIAMVLGCVLALTANIAAADQVGTGQSTTTSTSSTTSSSTSVWDWLLTQIGG